MPIPLTHLDDRRFTDLVQELRALIPRHAPEWTDHNLSDPGITLIELFAWLTESLLYRLNRIPEASEARFLELLGARFRSARPAGARLTVRAEGLAGPLVVDRGAALDAPAPAGGTLAFATVHPLRLTPDAPTGEVEVRQIERVAGEILGVSDGRPFQSFPLRRRFVLVEPALAFPLVPCVAVGSEAWVYRRSLADLGPGEVAALTLVDSAAVDPHFTVEPRLGTVRFGDGGREAGGGAGKIPPPGAAIAASYWITAGRRGGISAGTAFHFAGELGGRLTVTGVADAAAGCDPMTLDQARQEALALLRTRWRAITAEDFEEIVTGHAAAGIARARCLPQVDLTAADPTARAPGHVSVVIVPRQASAGLLKPSPEQVAVVGALLDERRLVTCRTHVVEPRYTEVRLTARIWRSPQADAKSLCSRILDRLEGFFDPLAGGPEGTGWPFGRDVHVSEVCQLLEAVPGVDHAEEAVLAGRGEGEADWRRYGDRVPVASGNLVSFDLAASTLRLGSGDGGEETGWASGGRP